MTRIPPTSPTSPSTGAARARRPASPFAVATPQADPDIAAAAGLEPVHLGGLLALQEAGPDSQRDRAARRHGHQILGLLRDLQLAALGTGTDPATLPRLARLAAAIPAADDPGLAAILHAIAVRAAVELARRDMAKPAASPPAPTASPVNS